jgi:hypothetical protein
MEEGRNVVQFTLHWIDAGKEPACPSDPAYPDGIDLDVSSGSEPTCKVPLPYPAKRIGSYVIGCNLCGIKVICTTAGRRDDPRSIRVRCQLNQG